MTDRPAGSLPLFQTRNVSRSSSTKGLNAVAEFVLVRDKGEGRDLLSGQGEVSDGL